MNGIAFDTLAASKALRDAGFEDRQAEAVTGVVRHAVGAGRDTLATKADLETGLAGLRADIYRALWAQGAGLIAVMTALIAVFKLFG